MWARKQIALTVCPKSYITGESTALLEEYEVGSRLGGLDAMRLSARQADAFLILEREIAAEVRDGQQNSRNIV